MSRAVLHHSRLMSASERLLEAICPSQLEKLNVHVINSLLYITGQLQGFLFIAWKYMTAAFMLEKQRSASLSPGYWYVKP